MEDGGSYMSVQNIQDIHEMSGELAEMIRAGDELEDWVEDKISASRQMVSDLHRFFTDGSAARVAARAATRNKEARNPPLQNASKATEALGLAYRLLVDLKLGFDSWEEIPKDIQRDVYDPVMKAMFAIGDIQQEVYNVGRKLKRKYM